MTLSEYCRTLTREDLFALAIKLCELSLPIWNNYSEKNSLEYRDTVVRFKHKVDPNLLQNCISYCQERLSKNQVSEKGLKILLEEFSDPIVSLQDSDWELPEEVKLTFYAYHNLLRGITEPMTVFDEQTHYVSINQSVDALMASGFMSIGAIKKAIYPSLN